MKIIYKNKKAYFDYEILEEYKAGLILTGSETKSVRNGGINLTGCYVVMQKEEAFLKGAKITQFKHDSSDDYDAFRMRKLLLKKKEIYKISNHLNTSGVTIVPLAIFLEKCYIKLLMGVARGKKKHDKRQSIKDKDIKKRLNQAMKRY